MGPGEAAGVELLLAGRVREAVEVLRAALLTSDDDSAGATHHNLALALRTSGDLDGAEEHARAAVAQGGGAASLTLLASLRELASHSDEAARFIEQALALDPEHAVARHHLGLLVARAGHRAAAAHHLRRAASSPSLPTLVRERWRGQLADLEAGGRPTFDLLCALPLVSEIVAPAPLPPHPAPAASVSGDGGVEEISVARAAEILRGARRVVALTGAGISTASGLRTRKQLWQTHDRDRAVSIWGFRRDPAVLWTVIRDFLGDGTLVPNAAHHALAALPRLTAVITQNVEGLHQAAATPCPVVELHGTLLATRCDGCGARGPDSRVIMNQPVPRCPACASSLRPDVVLFGEWVDPARLAAARAHVTACDVLLIVGSAMDVAPAADLPAVAAAAGATLIEIKHRASRLARALPLLHLAGPAEQLLPALLARR